ncbi:MAG: hypothetical protein JWP42_3834 [Pseudomonas sp.]|nr:hypothetical protein [Pseudomonas sp.]
MNHDTTRTESEPTMMLAPPLLAPLSSQAPDITTLKLSTLSDTLKILVPESDYFRANWDVYPILGDDPDVPDWAGLEEPAGIWDEVWNDMIKRLDIELHIPKEVLHRYMNTTVALRYKFSDESSMEPYSAPIMLSIEA